MRKRNCSENIIPDDPASKTIKYVVLKHPDNVLSFYVAAKKGSMSKASEILGFSVPAISKRIKVLEELLDKQLYTRSSTGILLTDFGEAFFKECEPFCKLMVDTDKKTKGKSLPTIELPSPFPCASTMRELVTEPITDNTLKFNFSHGIPGLFVEFVSMVYRFEHPISLSEFSVMTVDISYLTGDFRQINLEFHGESPIGVMNEYAQPIELIRNGDDGYRKTYRIFLNDDTRKNAWKRLREICFVVPFHVVLKANKQSGSFRINSITFH